MVSRLWQLDFSGQIYNPALDLLEGDIILFCTMLDHHEITHHCGEDVFGTFFQASWPSKSYFTMDTFQLFRFPLANEQLAGSWAPSSWYIPKGLPKDWYIFTYMKAINITLPKFNSSPLKRHLSCIAKYMLNIPFSMDLMGLVFCCFCDS